MNASRQRESEAVAVAVPRERQTVLWIIAILLAVIAVALVLRPAEPWSVVRSAWAGEPRMAGGGGVYAFTGQLDKNRYGLFMMDVDNGTIWCYEYLTATRKLKLVAARSFLYDRYLEDYSNDEPRPDQVQALLRDQNRIRERINGGDAATEDEGEDVLGTDVPGFPHKPDGGAQD